MANIINLGNEGFASARRSEYVDKSGLIGFVNRTLCSEDKFLCVTRARRFGKSMAAKMLNAYYDQSCNSDSLFRDLKIASDPTYRGHLNKYPVIYLDMTFFTTSCKHQDEMVEWIDRWVKDDLHTVYPDVPFDNDLPLISYLLALAEHQGKRFIMIVDEWDAICREASDKPELMRHYVDWLRSMFKGSHTDRVFAGVYMTGILPIKQYDTQSALNNFTHYSVLEPEPLQGYFGFTEDEVKALCERNDMDYLQLAQWYDGYEAAGLRIFNPNSVMKALHKRTLSNYWMQTGAYEGLKRYITMNLDGLRDAVVSLIGNVPVKVESLRIPDNLNVMEGRDSVLTTLVHLGYLTYNRDSQTVKIPNYEVKKEFEDVVRDSNWVFLSDAISQSDRLLLDTLNGDERIVAQAIEKVHENNTSIIRYNDENSLACVLSLAYYAAQREYVMVRELPAGKGFADLVLVPRRNVNKPALVLELKWNKTADAAIRQIKEKDYLQSLSGYEGEIILVAVNYDKKNKVHSCSIEKTSKTQGVLKEYSRSSQGVVKEHSWSKKQQEILAFCIESRSLEEIAIHLKVSDKYYMKRKHVNPMLGVDLFMTDPDAPNSPTQRYYSKK